jgi:hypothetical protein
VSTTYSEYVFVAVVIHCMRRVALSSVASLAVRHFYTLSHKRHDLKNIYILNIEYLF